MGRTMHTPFQLSSAKTSDMPESRSTVLQHDGAFQKILHVGGRIAVPTPPNRNSETQTLYGTLARWDRAPPSAKAADAAPKPTPALRVQ